MANGLLQTYAYGTKPGEDLSFTGTDITGMPISLVEEMPVSQPTMPIEPVSGQSPSLGSRAMGILGSIGSALGDIGGAAGRGLMNIGGGVQQFFQDRPDLLDTLSIGFGGMSMRPNEGLIDLAKARIAQREVDRQQESFANRTAEALRVAGREDLAAAIGANPELAPAIYQEYIKSTFATPDALDPTADMQNYKFYYDIEIAEGRIPMSFQDFRMSRPPSTQNIISLGDGQFQTGTIPPGYYLDTSGATPTMRVIPGGPAEIKEQQSQEQMQNRQQLAATAGNVVFEDIKRFKNLVSNQGFFTPVTGIPGFISRQIPSTAAADAENLKLTIEANIGFDRLQQMREASPTGGALGNVSDREIDTLQSVLGSLSTSQSDVQLLENLDRLEKIYAQILTKLQAYPNADEYGFGGPSPSGSQQIPSGDPAGIL
jgi:hypothetical protein